MKHFVWIILTFAIAACAPPVREAVTVKSSAPSGLKPDREYVALVVKDPLVRVGTFSACQYGKRGEIYLSARVNQTLTVNCTGGNTIHFGDANNTPPSLIQSLGAYASGGDVAILGPAIVFNLADGRIIKLVEIFDASSGFSVTGRLANAGKYSVISWFQRDKLNPKILGEQTSEYRFEPGAIHYLGELVGENSIVWNENSDLLKNLVEEYPALASKKIIAEEPAYRERECLRTDSGSIRCLKDAGS